MIVSMTGFISTSALIIVSTVHLRKKKPVAWENIVPSTGDRNFRKAWRVALVTTI